MTSAVHALAAPETHASPHIRDHLDLSAAMRCVLWAVTPAVLFGAINAGQQVLSAARVVGLDALPGWQLALVRVLGFPPSPESPGASLVVGLACAVPIVAVAAITGWLWSRLFARMRGRSSPEALPVAVTLFALCLPPGIPLWQVALGSSFAVVVGLEIFGGTGRNPVHPAVVGFVFLYFAYPASFSGPGVWVALEGAPGATVLGTLAENGPTAVRASQMRWTDTLIGWQPGALGVTSALASAIGGAFLVYAQLASWRVIAGGVLGLAASAALVNALGDPGRPGVGLPWAWHLTTGSFAFAIVFLATDPVTSPSTAPARFVYGILIGVLTLLVRVFSPSHPEGAMLAILLGNVLAPLLDHATVRVHCWRRRRRRG
jgi:Na+-transporting NADH:ubiquinone oxidoreductase subunit B